MRVTTLSHSQKRNLAAHNSFDFVLQKQSHFLSGSSKTLALVLLPFVQDQSMDRLCGALIQSRVYTLQIMGQPKSC
jgi:hypothetical protein